MLESDNFVLDENGQNPEIIFNEWNHKILDGKWTKVLLAVANILYRFIDPLDRKPGFLVKHCVQALHANDVYFFAFACVLLLHSSSSFLACNCKIA